ncbi:hypothetical protein BDZ91DRAFT_686888 [Kalaharituber pfeilii]|nr:hypothetical protein BDZ91DRAFT_686888 [Kalaharituber pfeilii]
MSRRPSISDRPIPRLSMGTVMFYGMGAGIIGVIAMTATEKLEQAITSRPDSYVPGMTLARLLGFSPRDVETRNLAFPLNMAMHYGQGALGAIIRALMSLYGLRGPFADFLFVGVRLSIDQTLENWMGVGAPPWTWPVNEQIIDLLHKAVYAFTTGYLTDRWIQ